MRMARRKPPEPAISSTLRLSLRLSPAQTKRLSCTPDVLCRHPNIAEPDGMAPPRKIPIASSESEFCLKKPDGEPLLRHDIQYDLSVVPPSSQRIWTDFESAVFNISFRIEWSISPLPSIKSRLQSSSTSINSISKLSSRRSCPSVYEITLFPILNSLSTFLASLYSSIVVG